MTTLRILFRLCTIVLFTVYYGIRLGLSFIYFALFRSGPDIPTLIGITSKKFCESVGATAIKIGQVASTRPDLFPPEVISAISRLQDQVKPVDPKKIEALIEKTFGRPLSEIFARFEHKPIASASIAQVHRAYLHSGETVAVKIRRPNLDKQIKYDLKILYAFSWLLGKLPPFRLIPLVALSREFGQAIERQMNFRLEAKYNKQFRHNFADNDLIRFPKLFESLCTGSIITMDFMSDLIKIDDLKKSSERRKSLATNSVQAFYKMMFEDGLIHSDLHPGNFFFTENDNLVILDTGLVTQLDETTKNNFMEFFFAMVTRNGKKCGQIICQSATYQRPDFDALKFTANIAKIVNHHADKNAEEFEVTSFAADLFAAQRHFGLIGGTDFTMTIVSLIVFEGIIKQVSPELDFQDEARRFILKTKYGLAPPRSIKQHGAEKTKPKNPEVALTA